VLDALDAAPHTVLFVDDNAINVDAAARAWSHCAARRRSRRACARSSRCSAFTGSPDMSLHQLLQARAAAGKPLRVALIGAGKFGAMYLAQAKHTPGIHIVGIADLAPERARAALARTGWADRALRARSLARGRRAGDDVDPRRRPRADRARPKSRSSSTRPATPPPASPTRSRAATHGKHVVMVNVEADALAGPLLARARRAAGIVYSLAYGDQPALICEMVDWGRAAGFEVVARRQGHQVPARVSRVDAGHRVAHYGFTRERRRRRFQRADVQLVPRRHEERDRDGRRGQRDGPDARARRPRVSRRAASTTCRACCGRARRRLLHHAGQVEVDLERERDGRPCSATCAGACT
jgi:hypothetical protein